MSTAGATKARRRISGLSIGTALLGLAGTTLLMGWVGFVPLARIILSAGWAGIAALVAWQMLVFGILGQAWNTLLPARDRNWLLLVWGRMVRDAAGNCLPFSPIGGFVFGARAVVTGGMPWRRAAASTVVDVTVEVLAQLAFAVIGLVILLLLQPNSTLATPLAGGLLAAIGIIGAFIVAQCGAASLFSRLGRRIGGAWFAQIDDQAATLQSELRSFYHRPRQLALALAIHLGGWLCSGVENWIGLHLVGSTVDLATALAIEALLRIALAAAFFVPGNIGVQEAAYSGLGLLFGVPPGLTLAVSLLRRARDYAMGIPILLLWQSREMRRLRPAEDT